LTGLFKLRVGDYSIYIWDVELNFWKNAII
jgi:hypothetical protein